MTRRRDLEHHRHSLGEIREIMNSMKTLAYMETRKLERFIEAQHAVVDSIEQIASDFLGFYPETLPEIDATIHVYLLIGTERGFCGDFNHSLIRHLEMDPQVQQDTSIHLIAVGRKLNIVLEDDVRVTARIDGPGMVEEVPGVLHEIMYEVLSLQRQHGMINVYGLHHTGDDGVVMQKLLPPFQQYLLQPSSFGLPPLLNLSPVDFFIELTDQYLFAAMYAMLYTSLLAENRNRVKHLEGAVTHLDDESAILVRQCNALRQEEIIEEIEVILLSASSLDDDR